VVISVEQIGIEADCGRVFVGGFLVVARYRAREAACDMSFREPRRSFERSPARVVCTRENDFAGIEPLVETSVHRSQTRPRGRIARLQLECANEFRAARFQASLHHASELLPSLQVAVVRQFGGAARGSVFRDSLLQLAAPSREAPTLRDHPTCELQAGVELQPFEKLTVEQREEIAGAW